MEGDAGVFSKLSGILASASFSRPNEASSLFGIGINVANTKPTFCLHDAIKMVAPEAELPTQAAVIACTLNHLEKLLALLESGGVKGLAEIQAMYTSTWVHK